MKRLLVSILTMGLLVSGGVIAVTTTAMASDSGTLGFGMDANSIQNQKAAGVEADYGVIWIGPWTLKYGWGGTNDRMTTMKNEGITPVIHFYYWGDDISPDCVENGCWSNLHNTWKDKDGWQELADQLVSNLHKTMDGKKVVVVMETEFNKKSLDNYKPFDYMLRDKTNHIKWKYSGAEMVLGLGNWNRWDWSTWSSSAKASHQIGIQGMRGSTKDSLSKYDNIFDETLAGAKKAQSLWGKPVFITDIALSSYPEPEYLEHQKVNLKKFFDGTGQLKQAGVTAIVYRAWLDQANKDTANYYGIAERYFGVASSDGKWKPAASVWVNGVKAERSGSSGSGSDSGSYSAEFTVKSSVNEWWIDVAVKSSPNPSSVHARVDGGSWQALDKTSWGTWAKSIHAPEGSKVEFRATASDGSKAYSGAFTWLSGSSTSSSSYSAEFTPRSSVNEWWIDVDVKASPSPSSVHARVDGGSWKALDKTSWGTWAKSIHAPEGSKVEFRATASDGSKAYSGAFTWLSGSSGSSSGSYSASFEPSSGVNEWWIDVKVTASPNPSKVHARVDGGSWQYLSKTSWGTWAKSIHAPEGSKVEFRATDSDGSKAYSESFTWLKDSFDAKFSPKGQGNEWWVETKVSSSESVSKVKACINGGSCTTLSKTSWGSWAKSFHVSSGSKVQFEATSSSGATATSSTYTW